MRKPIISMVIAMLIVMSFSLSSNNSSRLLQVTQRTAAVTKLCASFPSRTELISEQAKADADLNNAAMKSSFK